MKNSTRSLNSGLIFHVVNKKQNPFPVLVYAAGDLVAVALDCPGEFRFVGRADVRTQKDFIFSVHRVKAEKAEAFLGT